MPLGYKLYSIASRTYGSIVPVICGSRYTGKPKAIRCNADGVWSTPTGCSVPGKMYIQALTLYRGSYMSAHVLLNLLTSWGKEIKCEACRAFYLFFATSLINSMIQEHEC